MAELKLFKVVASLPASLEPDALYLVRAGAGFDLYATNHAGTVVSYPLNLPDLSTKQDAHANLSALSGVTGSAGAVFYFTAAGAGALAASSSLGRQLWNIIDAAAGRTLLALGTAATANATTSPTDTTPGRLWRTNDLKKQTGQTDVTTGSVLLVGAFGVGAGVIGTETDMNSYQTGGKYITPITGLTNLPAGWNQSRHVLEVAGAAGAYGYQAIYDAGPAQNRIATRTWSGAGYTQWVELWHNGNLIKQANQLDSSAGSVLVMGNSGVGPFGLGDVGYTLSDVNNLTYSGLGRVTALGTPNAPTAGAGYGIGMPHAAGMPSLGGQLFLNYTTDSGNYMPFPRLFARSKSSAAAFGNWAEFYSNRNILGTVGQASGIPTGAIIERDSNANGSYVKFADGTLICTHSMTINAAIGTAVAGGFRSSGQSWVYPAAFAAIPSVSFQPTTLTAISANGSAGTASSSWFVCAVTSQAAASHAVTMMAVGRWF